MFTESTRTAAEHRNPIRRGIGVGCRVNGALPVLVQKLLPLRIVLPEAGAAGIRELERLIEAMQRHWLLRKYVNKTNPPPIRPLTGSAEPEQKPVKGFRSPKGSTR